MKVREVINDRLIDDREKKLLCTMKDLHIPSPKSIIIDESNIESAIVRGKLKGLREKGYVEVKQEGRKFLYSLTQKGQLWIHNGKNLCYYECKK